MVLQSPVDFKRPYDPRQSSARCPMVTRIEMDRQMDCEKRKCTLHEQMRVQGLSGRSWFHVIKLKCFTRQLNLGPLRPNCTDNSLLSNFVVKPLNIFWCWSYNTSEACAEGFGLGRIEPRFIVIVSCSYFYLWLLLLFFVDSVSSL